MIHVKKFCITGGPCAGKTTSLAYIQEKLSERGFYPIIVPETATLLLKGGALPSIFSPLVFQTSVITAMHGLEKSFMHCAQNVPKGTTPILICDRGFADSAAYVPKDIYLEALKASGIMSEVEARDKHYDGVFHLVTAAKGAEQFYTNENNTVRLETAEQARELDTRTQAAWTGSPHLRIIDNSTDFTGKLARLDAQLCSALGIPVPLEIEKKFECESIDLSLLPPDAQHIDITQVYLRSEENVTLRVRQRGQHGAYTYYRTEKRDVAPGARSEIERLISAQEYEWSMQFQHQQTRILKKTRICFVHESQYFELDSIPLTNGETLWLLEIELTDVNEKFSLPPFIKVKQEVTHDRKFTNRALAEIV